MDSPVNDSQRHAQLAAQVRAALDAGSLSERNVAQLLAATVPGHRRRTFETVLVAIGALVVFAGLVLLYAVNFSDMGFWWRVVTPYAFPLVLLGATITVAVQRRQPWLQESSMAVTSLAVVGASSASILTIDPPNRDWYVLSVAAFSAAGAMALLQWLPQRLVTAWWTLAIALAAMPMAAASIADVADHTYAWVAIGTGVAVGLLGVPTLLRELHRAGGAFLSVGAAMLFVGSMIGINTDDVSGATLTGWHALFTLVIVTAIIAGASTGLPELAITGGAGVLQWIGLAAQLVNEQPLWALAIIALGTATVAAAIYAMRRRERHEREVHERHGGRPVAG